MSKFTTENKLQPIRDEQSPDQTRRKFLNKFGKLAVITPIAMTSLMSPSTSAAPKSCRGNGKKGC